MVVLTQSVVVPVYEQIGVLDTDVVSFSGDQSIAVKDRLGHRRNPHERVGQCRKHLKLAGPLVDQDPLGKTVVFRSIVIVVGRKEEIIVTVIELGVMFEIIKVDDWF